MKLLVEINEELLNYFKKYWLIGANGNDRVDELVNSIRNATPITECEDCINRKEYLKKCESYCDANCKYSKQQRDVMCSACMMGDAIEFAEDMPTVYPKSDNPSGKWIHGKERASFNCGEDKIPFYENWTCSECGNVVHEVSNYCPKCGSKNDSTHWIFHGKRIDGVVTFWYTCSKCKYRVEDKNVSICPNCGAKMNSEVEDGTKTN